MTELSLPLWVVVVALGLALLLPKLFHIFMEWLDEDLNKNDQDDN
jgi:hypothetical protein